MGLGESGFIQEIEAFREDDRSWNPPFVNSGNSEMHVNATYFKRNMDCVLFSNANLVTLTY